MRAVVDVGSRRRGRLSTWVVIDVSGLRRKSAVDAGEGVASQLVADAGIP